MKKSWHIDRRRFLRGTSGMALALPFMNAMAWGKESKVIAELPKRSMFISFPNGACMPPEDSEHYEDWNWFPKGNGKNHQLRENHKHLVPHKDDISFISGLSNPKNRSSRPHVGPSAFLTTQQMDGKHRQTISIDQEIVNQLNLGKITPVDALVLSTIGGAGSLGRAKTLSYNKAGNPIPALSQLSQIYKKLYQAGSSEYTATLKQKKHMLDSMLSDAKSLGNKLGAEDKQCLDEYLSSIREVEKKIEHQENWSGVMKEKAKNAPKLELDISFESIENYMQTLYDLVFISFQTDLTRVATYQIAPEDVSKVDVLSKHIGLPFALHALSHRWKEDPNVFKDWGSWDQFVGKQLAYLVNKLKNTKEADSTLLDRTLIFQGSATGKSHNPRNYPLLLAGGQKMGHKAGQFVSYDEEKHALSDLYVNISNSMGAPIKKFGDSSNKAMPELFG